MTKHSMTSAASAVALGLAAAFSTGLPAFAQTSNNGDSLQKQVDALKARVKKLETASSSASASLEKGPVKGSFKIPGTSTSLAFGGFARGDLITDFNGYDGASFSAADIPLEQDRTHNLHTQLTAQNSRFNVTSLTPSDYGLVKGFLEIDFRGTAGSETITNSHQPRLRHAYVEFPVSPGGRDKILVGQTWSTAFSLGTSATTLAWNGSEGGIMTRQGQIRWTHKLTDATNLEFSIENPQTEIGNAPSNYSAGLNDFYPDIVGKVTTHGSWGHGDIALFNQFPRIHNSGINKTAYAWGLEANGAFEFTPRDTFYVQTNGGQGEGRYLDASFKSGYLVGSKIKLNKQYGFRLGIEHEFSKSVIVNLSGGMEENIVPTDSTGSGSDSVNKQLWSTHLNLLYKPFPDAVPNLSTGIEYTHGYRKVQSGRHGQTDLIDFMTRYRF